MYSTRATDALSQTGPRPWFYIGSVEALERNLEAAQTELQIAPANHVDVIYKQSGSEYVQK